MPLLVVSGSEQLICVLDSQCVCGLANVCCGCMCAGIICFCEMWLWNLVVGMLEPSGCELGMLI